MSEPALTILILGVVVAGTIAYVGWGSDEERVAHWNNFFASHPFKFGLIVVIALALLLPLMLLDSVIARREEHYKAALGDIGKVWGNAQTVVGPLLVVPYEYTAEDAAAPAGSGNRRTVRKLAVFLPEELIVKTVINPVRHSKGIFESLVYKSDIQVSGRFAQPDFSRFPHRPSGVDYKGAYLSLGLGDTRAIVGRPTIRWNDRDIEFSQGTNYSGFLPSGLHSALPTLQNERKDNPFSLGVSVSGSEGFLLAPLGKTTVATMESPWPSPSFRGVRPTNSSVTSKGFSAEWRIPHLARSYPQQWIAGNEGEYLKEIKAFYTGVQLFEPNGFYQTVQRAMEFGIVHFGLSFLLFFVFTIVFGTQIGGMQYLQVGGMLCLFYFLLVSLAEHIGFRNAYIASSVVVVASITTYSAVILKSRRLALFCFAQLVVTYALLFVLLKQPEYGFVFSAGLFFVALVLSMYLTRNPNDPAVMTTAAESWGGRGGTSVEQAQQDANIEDAVTPAVALVLGTEKAASDYPSVASVLGKPGRDPKAGGPQTSPKDDS